MPQVVVGQPVVRQDAFEKVTGAVLYAADLRLPGMLYGKALRRPHPHAPELFRLMSMRDAVFEELWPLPPAETLTRWRR